MIPWLHPGDEFPPLVRALREPNGLIAAGGDLSIAMLLKAYSHGIFPWFGEDDPIYWWSPDPRMVLFPDELRITRSMRKILRNKAFEVTVDRDFHQVILECAGPRRDTQETWITPDMVDAYLDLHRAGYAHSVETRVDGQLVGGLYGVAIGRAFFGESMFTRVSNASKIALVTLTRQLLAWDFGIIDCQMRTGHLASLGAREIPRAQFAQRLIQLVDYAPVPGPWEIDIDASV